jgi:phosphoglycerol geranylgeranyltransferase
MLNNTIYNLWLQKKVQGKKALAVLIDPDKASEENLNTLCIKANNGEIDYFFVGGSILTAPHFETVIKNLKKNSVIPVILFPGGIMQIHRDADAILFLSLISGRNADLLIGKHVEAAPLLKQTNIEIISTGYMLIESGKSTSVSYMSQTMPLPNDKPDIALCTALAGEMLGLKCTYLEAGSGAMHTVPESIINTINKNIDTPLIVGGGIKTSEQAKSILQAGADIIVIGTQVEKKNTIVTEIAKIIHQINLAT